ncbi:hypothetical protein PENSPDRAFT_756515 [Peniophora sp. CONT]|nr:hypothetical protein PENSPDRAFT_756515 [Peniophora sp. CONT]
MAAAPPPQQAIAERAEIHKSCRALETVVNVLNDYSEAARAIVTLQKKLAKALRDASSCKATGDIASNAFSSSASLFDALSEIDSKYAKIADKECDAVTGEVRKWFKKLAKEEKAHDDRMAAVNARIKAAGASYEKKAKKNTYDAADEHTRYINLLTSLGPELTQEKYNHQLGVSQRSTAITYSVAATAARLADAEWLRATEGVRRFAPLIGSVGEWRSLCEGGWTAAPPEPLPDLDAPPRVQPQAQQTQSGGSPLPRYVVPSNVLANLQPSTPSEQPKSPLDQPRTPNEPPTPSAEENGFMKPEDRNRTLSMANLASFPTPPTHFPLPPVSKPSTPLAESPMKQLMASPLESTPPLGSRTVSAEGSALSKVSDSSSQPNTAPASTEGSRSGPSQPYDYSQPSPATSASSSAVPGRPDSDKPRDDHSSRPSRPSTPTAPALRPSSPTKPSTPFSRDRGSASYGLNPSRAGSPRLGTGASTLPKGDYLEDRDFSPTASGPDKARSLDSVTPRRGTFDRTDTMRSTGSSTSIARDKMARTTGPGSPPPRDIPRLNQSVTEIASKFLSNAGSRPPLSPVDDGLIRRSYDASTARRSQDLGDNRVRRSVEIADLSATPTRPTTMYVDDLDRRRARVAELEELERRERELEDRSRDRRWRDEGPRRPEDDRGLGRLREEDEQVQGTRRYGHSPDPAYRTREPQREEVRQRPGGRSPVPSSRDGYSSDAGRSYNNRPMSSGALPIATRYSQSTTHLAQPQPSSAGGLSSRTSSDQPFPSPSPATSPGLGVSTHPGNCTCPACTVERAANGQPPEVRERKTSGWRRRLSMPVIIPFTGDGKKDKGISGGKPLGHQPNSSVTSFGMRR